MRRYRYTKIVATLGPSSSKADTIESLFLNGVDVFRLNFSHGSHETHEKNLEIVRSISEKYQRPIGVMADLQGPKLRVGTFQSGPVLLAKDTVFRLDLDSKPGDQNRVSLPHVEIFQALTRGAELLLDDGKIRLKVEHCGEDYAVTRVMVGGTLSERKGVNVPGCLLPISALTPKDLKDLDFALKVGADWIALSFVQRASDVMEARRLVGDRAFLLAKLEKPQAIDHLEEIIGLSDAVMVARGDLGVEMLPEEVPSVQKRIIRSCRAAGKPVVVATQMLDSMIHAPTPTRAEASDVATAVYDGVDAVMLSAESASGEYPLEAVQMMHRIIQKTEQDPLYRNFLEASCVAPLATPSDAITAAARHVAKTVFATAIVTLTNSGSTSWRAARERPTAPILALTPHHRIAQALTLAWGTHPVVNEELDSVSAVIKKTSEVIVKEGFGKKGDEVVITAGHHFDKEKHHTVFESGTTRVLRLLRIEE